MLRQMAYEVLPSPPPRAMAEDPRGGSRARSGWVPVATKILIYGARDGAAIM